MKNGNRMFSVFSRFYRKNGEAKHSRQNYENMVGVMRSTVAESGHKSHIPANVEFWSSVAAYNHGIPIATVDSDLAMPEEFAVKVRTLRHAAMAPDWASITAWMTAHPQHLGYDPKRPYWVEFDAEAAGAPAAIVHTLYRHPEYASDLAAEVLHDVDPVRNQIRLSALAHLRGKKR